MGILNYINNLNNPERRERQERAYEREQEHDREQRAKISAAIQLHHETTRNNYIRSKIIKENQERMRKGQPTIPVPPGDYR